MGIWLNFAKENLYGKNFSIKRVNLLEGSIIKKEKRQAF
jgi:hypothetical protein